MEEEKEKTITPKEEPKEEIKLSVEEELKKKEQEIAALKKRQQEEILEKERVDIPDHKHCNICGRPFYTGDYNNQIKTCLICAPQRT